jgi:hypothetical protein
MWLLFSADYVVVPGKFYIVFLKKREVGKKKIVIKRPVIFISIEGKKRNPTGLN